MGPNAQPDPIATDSPPPAAGPPAHPAADPLGDTVSLAPAAAAPAAGVGPTDSPPLGLSPGAPPGTSPHLPTRTAPAALPAGPLRPADLGSVGSVRLIEEVGRGGMGIVCRGHDRVLGRDVAVKFLSDAVAPDPAAIGRFLDEMRAAAAVRHPNLTQIFHADVAAERPYLVMEYVSGPNLRRLVARVGPLPVAVAVVVLEDVAAAVGALHDRGLLHRDLKPANVLVDSDGRARVTDFGLVARRAERGEGAAHTAMGAAALGPAGTPLYMAPELFDGRASPRTDIYALGVTAFEVLTSRRPFDADSYEGVRAAHASRPLPVDWLVELGVPAGLVEVIERAAHKQAMFRYKAAGDFLRALKTAAGDLVGAGPAERARVRGQLGRLVLRSRIDPDAGQPAGDTPPGSKGSAGAVPNEPPATPAAETPTATPPASPAAPPTASTVSPTYEQTLARIAAIKRSGRPSPSADTPVPFPPPPPPGPPSLPPTAGGVPVPAEPLPAMFQPPPAMPSPANPPSSTGSAPSPRKSRWYWPWRRPPQSS